MTQKPMDLHKKVTELEARLSDVESKDENIQDSIQQAIEEKFDYRYASRDDMHELNKGINNLCNEIKSLKTNLWVVGSVIVGVFTIGAAMATIYSTIAGNARPPQSTEAGPADPSSQASLSHLDLRQGDPVLKVGSLDLAEKQGQRTQ